MAALLEILTTLEKKRDNRTGLAVGFPSEEFPQRYFMTVTQSPARLIAPPQTRDGRTYRYGVAAPFQIAPGLAGLMTSVRNEGFVVGDFENGCDLILFEDIDNISTDNCIEICRNTHFTNEAGEDRIILRFPIRGGFVPYGAKREDGSPHPFAGTGFGLCEAADFPRYKDGYYSKADKQDKAVRTTEVYQFAYDGNTFRVVGCEVYGPENPIYTPGSEWALTWPSLTEGVMDGDDYLFPVLAMTGDVGAWYTKRMAAGVSRWRYEDGQWKAISFVPVIVAENVPKIGDPEQAKDPAYALWMEPSIARDTDGSYLFTARGCYGLTNNLLKVWRSRDDAANWDLIIDQPEARAQSTTVMGRSADGVPYIICNELGRERDKLVIYPLNTERNGLEDAVLVRDALEEFGPPPSGKVWFMDHPGSSTLFLSDGKWHHVISYRIMDRGEHAGGVPPPQTGQYVEEVITDGEVRPPWRFG